MLSVVKTVVLSARNAEEIAIASLSLSKFISSLMHFIAGIYNYCMGTNFEGSIFRDLKNL